MGGLKPLWIDITWGFGDVGAKTIEACRHVQKTLGLPVLMHLICTDMTTADLDAALSAARLAGVRAILVLRGYTQAGYDRWQPCAGGLHFACELCSYIRRAHGDHFSIGVAGFPATHPESRRRDVYGEPSEEERAKDVEHLKAKVDAGADFIICQFTFSVAEWGGFLRRCRAAGIVVPILPGVMPLTEYASARLLSEAWGVSLPAEVAGQLRACAQSADEDGAFECGLAFIAALCDAILHHAACSQGEGLGLHLFVYDGEREVRALLEALEERYGWRRGCGPPSPRSPPAPLGAPPTGAVVQQAERKVLPSAPSEVGVDAHGICIQ